MLVKDFFKRNCFINKFMIFNFQALSPKSCNHIKCSEPSAVSGIYEIEVDGEKLEVRCQMNIASGGWTVSFYLLAKIY